MLHRLKKLAGFLSPANEVWGKVIFLHLSVILLTGVGMHDCWGACVVAGGHTWLPGGYAWLWGACMVAGGMRGCQGVCVVAGGCAWLLGVCSCQGTCMVARWACVVAGVVCVVARGACIGYNEIRSMSRQYASYWNAFLFEMRILLVNL